MVPEGIKIKFLVRLGHRRAACLQEDCKPGQCSVGDPGAHKPCQPVADTVLSPGQSLQLPHAAARWLVPCPPFLQAPWEYLLLLLAMKWLKCLCVPSTAPFGLLQPEESTCPSSSPGPCAAQQPPTPPQEQTQSWQGLRQSCAFRAP